MPTERELIEEYIRKNGVTTCPAAIVAETEHATLSAEDRAIHRARGIDPMGDLYRKEPRHKRLRRQGKIVPSRSGVRRVSFSLRATTPIAYS